MQLSQKTAVVLFDHGSREQGPRALTASVFQLLQQSLASSAVTLLRASMEPFEIWHWLPHKLQEAVEDHDAEIVVALPFFLFPGKHMSEDNPEIVRDLQNQYPDRRFILAPPLLANADLAPAVADRALGALARSPHPRQTAVLSIAHGNRRSAHAEGRTAFQTELQARIQPHAAVYEETVLKFEFNNLLFRRMTPLIERGISDFVLVPLFLASGTYTDRFIPFVLKKIRLLHPHITTELLPPLGEYPETLQVLKKRLETALRSDQSD
jgi:sirohydrochlorin cobaltochelatase